MYIAFTATCDLTFGLTRTGKSYSVKRRIDKMSIPKIAVVGGGIIGLSTALSIVEEIPGVQVTIIADKWSPETTGDGAAGLWMPYLLGTTNGLQTQMRRAKQSFEFLERLFTSPNSSEIGISLTSGYFVDSKEPVPFWKDIVYGFRPMDERECRLFNANNGYAFTTFITECRKFLPYLMKRFQAMGGKLEMRKVQKLEELSESYDIVVNSPGVLARQLANDKEVHPIRGQVLRVKAPWIKTFVINDDHYIIPNSETVVVGGTHQVDNWSTAVDVKDTKEILQGCYRIIPSLKNATVISEWVGLRPGRVSVRIEREQITHKNKTLRVIHHYGHGGSGVTVFWGCAQEALQLVHEALKELVHSQNRSLSMLKSNI